MKFFTPITNYKETFKLSPCDEVLALGSCFANVVGQKLKDNRVKVLLNPFGTLYNPRSILDILQLGLDLLDQKATTDDMAKYIFKSDQGLYYTWLSASLISGTTFEECLNAFTKTMQTFVEKLKTVDVIMITFGTNRYYFLKQEIGHKHICVANCHKMPSAIFEEKSLDVDEIVSQFNTLFSRIKKTRTNLKVLFTVSPYRYIKYGLHESQLSKAALMLAIDKCIKTQNDLYYFPAYEILNDELRDYRYYAPDMVHPSSVAEEYVWETFSEHYLSADLKAFIKEWSVILKMQEHRPLTSNSANILQQEITKRKEIIKEKYPQMF